MATSLIYFDTRRNAAREKPSRRLIRGGWKERAESRGVLREGKLIDFSEPQNVPSQQSIAVEIEPLPTSRSIVVRTETEQLLADLDDAAKDVRIHVRNYGKARERVAEIERKLARVRRKEERAGTDTS